MLCEHLATSTMHADASPSAMTPEKPQTKKTVTRAKARTHLALPGLVQLHAPQRMMHQ